MSLYDSTVEMLSFIPENELEAINIVVKGLVSAYTDDSSFFRRMTKAEMMDKLAQGRKQIEEGQCEDSEIMEAQLAEEFGF